MSSIGKTILIALLGTAIAAGTLRPAAAQEISESTLAAAQLVTKSAPTIRDWNVLLPELSTQTKDLLIRRRPDLYKEIGTVVDEAALKLAARRTDLDNDIARVWAKYFTEDELVAINTFFSSEVGTKYKEVAAKSVAPEIIKAGNNWTNRVGDELLEKSMEELKKMGFEF